MRLLVSLTLIAATVGWYSSANAGYTVRVIASEDAKHVTDAVESVGDEKGGVVVSFAKAAGQFHMKRNLRNFSAFKKKLSESAASKQPVTVTLDASGLNILEVK